MTVIKRWKCGVAEDEGSDSICMEACCPSLSLVAVDMMYVFSALLFPQLLCGQQVKVPSLFTVDLSMMTSDVRGRLHARVSQRIGTGTTQSSPKPCTYTHQKFCSICVELATFVS